MSINDEEPPQYLDLRYRILKTPKGETGGSSQLEQGGSISDWVNLRRIRRGYSPTEPKRKPDTHGILRIEAGSSLLDD